MRKYLKSVPMCMCSQPLSAAIQYHTCLFLCWLSQPSCRSSTSTRHCSDLIQPRWYQLSLCCLPCLPSLEVRCSTTILTAWIWSRCHGSCRVVLLNFWASTWSRPSVPKTSTRLHYLSAPTVVQLFHFRTKKHLTEWICSQVIISRITEREQQMPWHHLVLHPLPDRLTPAIPLHLRHGKRRTRISPSAAAQTALHIMDIVDKAQCLEAFQWPPSYWTAMTSSSHQEAAAAQVAVVPSNCPFRPHPTQTRSSTTTEEETQHLAPSSMASHQPFHRIPIQTTLHPHQQKTQMLLKLKYPRRLHSIIQKTHSWIVNWCPSPPSTPTIQSVITRKAQN